MITTSDLVRQRKRRKFTLIFLVILITGSLGLYAWLGGFKSPVISEANLPGYLMVGQAYQGSPAGQPLHNLFNQMTELNRSGKLPGTLTTIFYDIKDLKKDSVSAFVGVIVKDSSVTLPKESEFRYFPVKNAIRAEITAHFLVATAPGKVQLQMTEYAKQKGLTPYPYVIEKHYGPRHIVMELPVKQR